MICMAVRRVTLSIDQDAYDFAELIAKRSGFSISAWISGAVRREAVRQGAGTNWGHAESEALPEDTDLNTAEANQRAAGELRRNSARAGLRAGHDSDPVERRNQRFGSAMASWRDASSQ
jgi:hypothetical protein